MQPKLRLSKSDAVVASGIVHIVDNVTSSTIEMRPLDGSSDLLCLSHGDLKAMLDQCKATIEYGYFSSAQAARRALAGSSIISRMDPREQALIFWKQMWVEGYLKAERDGEVKRSDASTTRFLPELAERMEALLLEYLKTGAGGSALADLVQKKPPCRTSLMGWVRDWERTRDPMSLIKRSRFNGANAKSVSHEVEAILAEAIKTYLHPNRMNVRHVTDEANRTIRQFNKTRALNGHAAEREVGESTVRRRINNLNKFETCAAREGVAIAKNKYGPHEQGIDIEAPMQRVEMDEWQIDLLAILEEAKVDLSDPKFDEIITGRYWVCVAIDTATRVILAVKLSRSPSTEAALATLWFAMRNKSQISKDLGCQKDWKQHGHIFNVLVDNGPSFVNPEFKAAMSDLGIGYEVLPAGVPKLRARIERVFRSLGTLLMPFLTGRTFGSIEEKGDYAADKYVVHTADSIVEILVRFTVDAYHHRSQRGLEYATPADTWDRLIGTFGESRAKYHHILRHFLGIPLQRQLGRHGVHFCGIAYSSEKLARYFQDRGGHLVDVRVDPEDLGHVSVWFHDAWHTVPAMMTSVNGVSLAVWEVTIRDLRRSNKAAARLHIHVVDQALERIKQIDDEQRAKRQIGPISVSARDIKRAERESFLGLSFGETDAASPPAPDAISFSDALNGGLTPRIETPSRKPDAPTQSQPNSQPDFEWRFSDDDDAEE